MRPQRSLLQNDSVAVYPSNAFVFIEFRTVWWPRTASKPFVINHFRTLSHATEGGGAYGFLNVPVLSLFAPCYLVCFHANTNCPICKSFVLKRIQQYPGGWGAPGASLLRPSRRTLSLGSSEPVSATLVPRIGRSPVRGFFSILSAVNRRFSRGRRFRPGRNCGLSTCALNPLECALTSHSQRVENTNTLSPLECAVTRFHVVTPLECALTKNRGRGAPAFAAAVAFSAASPNNELVAQAGVVSGCREI
jgi:hypothetical protein